MATSWIDKKRFCWKIDTRLYLLRRHKSMSWPDMIMTFLARSWAKDAPPAIQSSARSAQCKLGGYFWKKTRGSHHLLSPPTWRRLGGMLRATAWDSSKLRYNIKLQHSTAESKRLPKKYITSKICIFASRFDIFSFDFGLSQSIMPPSHWFGIGAVTIDNGTPLSKMK